MSDYDYLNARIRGMSTALLTREFYEQVLSAGDTLLLDALLASPYGEEVGGALAGQGDAPQVARAVETALRRKVHATFAKVLSLAPPEPRRLLALQLNRWDVANVLAVLRGRLAGAAPREVLAAVLPIGELDETQIGGLAAEPDVESLADALTAGKHPFAFVLRRAIRECEAKGDPRALERDLYRAYFLWALSQLREDDLQQALVRDMMRRQIDLVNVIMLLSLVRDRERGASDGMEPLRRGMLSSAILRELAAAETLEAAFETLDDTYLSPGIEKGILAYGQARSLAVMERFLEAVVVEHGCRLFRKDMLGIAVPLGFIWRTYSELVNVRMLARGAVFRMPPNAVREELVLV